ncbi:FtsX-like permease family protein [Anaerococcus rubeinfantis]|uniref:FtsX-like permease family protein n=1 Tax=Anaerococcus rubeinfantis TaxID=1720199 RepID=UPI00073E6C5C|nr:FtsX-like permease family protein [Anaerococcus rubeinfantis]
MKKNNYYKSIFRDIKNTKGKIFSIFVMIGLASMVVVALFLSGPSMRKTLNETLNKNRHPDIIVRASYGIKNEDRLIIEKDEDIDKISYKKNLDLFAKDKLISVKSYDENLRKLNIKKGRKIKKSNEIILDELLKKDYKIGDFISFETIDDEKIGDLLKIKKYKVVGFANSSEYLMDDIRDVSIKGKEMVFAFAYLDKENFRTDNYNQVDISYKKTKNMDRFSDDYKSFVKKKRDNLRKDFKNRPSQVLKKTKDEANSKLDEKEKKLSDGEKKLKEGKDKLIEANEKLNKGLEDYNKAEDDFNFKIRDGENQLAKSKSQIDSGFKKLNDGKNLYYRNLSTFYEKIKENEEKLKDSKIKLDQAYDEINKNYEKINSSKDLVDKSFADKKAMVEDLEEKISKENSNLSSNKNKVKEIDSKIENLKIKLESLSNQSSNNKDEIQTLKKELEKLNQEKNYLQEKINQSEKSLESLNQEYFFTKNKIDKAYDQAMAPINENLEKLNKAKASLDEKNLLYKESKRKFDQEKLNGSNKLNQAKKDLDQNEKKLNEGLVSYNSGKRKLNEEKIRGREKLDQAFNKLLENQKNLDKANIEYEKNSSNAKKDIDDGYEKIKKARQNLVKLVDPSYEIETIFLNKSIDTYYKNSLNMDELSKVFPTFFYFIALLVSITTIKRYIEEQRIQNGTLKALGYSNFDIGRKFFIYALIPTIFGSITGAILGKYIICKVIFKAYSSGFDVLSLSYINSNLIVLFTIFLSVFLISMTVYFTSISEVKEQTADLLRAKAPKKGSRIFLEKIKFIWMRLSFMTKITFRNLFRYKSRMLMTIFGIGGCTALLFFGFAMTDSVKDTSKLQRQDITKYDFISIFDKNADEKDKNSYENILKNSESMKILYQKADVDSENGNMKVNLMVFDNPSKVDDFIKIRDKNKKKIKLDEKSVIISKNLSNKINLNEDLKFETDKDNIKVGVSGVAENYIDDYIYMSKKAYEKIFSKKFIANADLVRANEKTRNKILNNKASLSLVEPNKFYETMDVLMANLNLVIGIITLVSMILAVVVLYNLTNINVSERKKELATTKVLGFFPRETTAYIYRETYILTILGIILGYILGYLMLVYVLNVVAPEGIYISHKTHLSPYIISAFITLFTSFLIMIVVHFKLKKINMAEAMKAGE